MNNWIDFIYYMMFSSYEYLSIFLVIMNVFNFKLRYYWKEIIGGALITTVFSYVLTIYELYNAIPLPLVIIPVMIVIFTLLMKRKIIYSTVVITGSFIFYGLIQFAVFSICLYFGGVTSTDINNPFSYKTYILQTICATISIVIAFYIKLVNSGFGFSLENVRKSYSILFGVLGLLVISCSIYTMLYLALTSFVIFLITLIFLIMTFVFFYLSFKQDQKEFN